MAGAARLRLQAGEKELKYAKINEEELRQMEEEFGRPLNEELALWFIRNRTQREAIERMLGQKPEDCLDEKAVTVQNR